MCLINYFIFVIFKNSLLTNKIIISCFEIESWVHVGPASGSGSQGGGTPGSVTPQLNVEEYLRLLREAQRESNESSARVSSRSSPKSPPNSPVQGTPLMEWQSYYVNTEPRHGIIVIFN